jgi:hypothetical protein
METLDLMIEIAKVIDDYMNIEEEFDFIYKNYPLSEEVLTRYETLSSLEPVLFKNII